MEWTPKRILSVGIFGAIILVFALFGLPTSDIGGGGGAFVAVVNDTLIPVADFQQEMQQMEQMYGQFFGGNAGAQQSFIRAQAVEKLINREIIAQETDKNTILSPDNEIRDFLVEQPFFQDNGRFNRDKYDNFLKRTGRTANEFENQLRKDLRGERLNNLFSLALKPTAGILQKERDLKSYRIDLQYAKIQPVDLEAKEKINASESEMTKWEGEHKKDIADYYQNHSDEFNRDEEVRARHILIKTQKGDKKSEESALKKIQNIATEAKASDFGDLAKKYSEDSSKNKKGDLGFFGRGRMVPEFEKAAFTLPINKVSEPIKTEFGYHLIQVTEKKAKAATTLEQASHEITQKLMRKFQFSKSLGELRQLLSKKDQKAVESWLNRYGIKWEDTGAFSLGDYSIPKLGNIDDFSDAMKSLSPQSPWADKLVASQGAEYLLKFKSNEMKDEKLDLDALTKEVSRNRGMGAMNDWIKTARKTASIKTNQRFVGNAQMEE